MKNGASGFVKQIISVITSIAKAKSSLALKTTKSSAVKSRLVLLSLLRNKKVLLSTISYKLHALLAGQRHDHHHAEDIDQSKASSIVPYNNAMQNYQTAHDQYCMIEGGGGSVIEMVRHSKEEEGEEFILEDEIDQVADLFIKRFHCQIRMQKQLSFKMYQEMLERSV